MKTNHTPGPWKRKSGERFKHDQSAGIRGADGKYVASALDFNQFSRDEEVEANALLIAAAPDLLNELENVETLLASFAKGADVPPALLENALYSIQRTIKKARSGE